MEIVLGAVKFSEKAKGADLVITGEGKIDSQTVYGKTPAGVARAAKTFGIPVVAIAGNVSADTGAVYGHGIDAAFSILPRAMSLREALETAAENIECTAANIAALCKLGKGKGL